MPDEHQGRPAAHAARVAAQLGLPSQPVRLPDLVGHANHVFVLGEAGERYVVRFPRDPSVSDGYAVETWCLKSAAEQGIPVPEVLAVGGFDEIPYMVQRFVPAATSGDSPSRTPWRVLGSYARRIARIPLGPDAPEGLFTRFGRDLETAWRSHLEYNLASLDDDDPLIDLGVYLPSDRARLRELITELAGIPMTFGLSHGDLSPRNLRMAAEPVLIDWGSASAGPVPHTDLLHLNKFHDEIGAPSELELAAFCDGFGASVMPSPSMMLIARVVSSLDLVRWALAHRPDRVAEMTDAARRLLARSSRG